MSNLRSLFASPDLYPLRIDFGRQRISFARISQELYLRIVWLSAENALRRSKEVYDIRLDDALLAGASPCRTATQVHYILHTAYCCSTLLARYFELVSSCFVLKEPEILAQVAIAFSEPSVRWCEAFDLCLRLLSRTYDPRRVVVIKTHVPTNVLGMQLLERNQNSTITFLMTPLREFLLAVLKSDDRKIRVREWIRYATGARSHPALPGIDPNGLTDVQAAAYWWLLNRMLCRQLCSSPAGNRVTVIDGAELAESPERVLKSLVSACGLLVDMNELKTVVDHPTVRKYSKDLSKSYDAKLRRQELADIESRWRRELEHGIAWAGSFGLDSNMNSWRAE
jgi:hypothetical protein